MKTYTYLQAKRIIESRLENAAQCEDVLDALRYAHNVALEIRDNEDQIPMFTDNQIKDMIKSSVSRMKRHQPYKKLPR